MHYQIAVPDRAWAEGIFEKLHTKLKAECSRVQDGIPYISCNGRYRDHGADDIYWWTNGFWAGMLWQMYHASRDDAYRRCAESVEKRFDAALEGYEGLHHDVGFMWLHTAAANYRLTANKDSRRRALHAAALLAGRYNPAGRFIRAWNGERAGWIIIDTMMNIPLLYWASQESGDPRFRYIAQSHADTALNILLRPDGSSNHIAVLDPHSGACLETPAGQGFASGSSWSRGQSWAVYGFALSYRHTGKQAYLDAAKQSAHYAIANFAQNDWLPIVDFRSPAEPLTYDSTAGMISACGFLEIAAHVGEHEKPLYTRSALKLLQACERAFADWDIDRDGIIGKGTAAYHGGAEDTEVPLIYGDYFFTEAVLRLLEKDFLIW